MQNYSDSRTVFIKNLLRYYLYKTHFYRSDGAEMKMADDIDKKSSILGDGDADRNPHFGRQRDEGRGEDAQVELKKKVLSQLVDQEAQNTDHNSNEPPVLSKPDEEIITELTYKM
jgi:hypothetical protein